MHLRTAFNLLLCAIVYHTHLNVAALVSHPRVSLPLIKGNAFDSQCEGLV